jgi:hypothetical protein
MVFLFVYLQICVCEGQATSCRNTPGPDLCVPELENAELPREVELVTIS